MNLVFLALSASGSALIPTSPLALAPAAPLVHAQRLGRAELCATAKEPKRLGRALDSSGRALDTQRDLVSSLLRVVDGTDRGVAASDKQRAEAASIISALEESQRGMSALARPNALFRFAEVAYVGQTSSRTANAAGGKYRGALGRFVCPTDALFQHVLADGAFNVVHFRFFGLIPAAAILRGRWRRASSATLEALRERARAATPPRSVTNNLVSIDFDAPLLAIGRTGKPLCLRIGPRSTVQLDTTYLDERIRIARGGTSGTPFVLRMDSCADGRALAEQARLYEQVLERRPLGKRSIVPVLLAAAAAIWRLGSRGAGVGRLPLGLTLGKLAAVLLAAVAAAVLRSTGGIDVAADAAGIDAAAAGTGPLAPGMAPDPPSAASPPRLTKEGEALWLAQALQEQSKARTMRKVPPAPPPPLPSPPLPPPPPPPPSPPSPSSPPSPPSPSPPSPLSPPPTSPPRPPAERWRRQGAQQRTASSPPPSTAPITAPIISFAAALVGASLEAAVAITAAALESLGNFEPTLRAPPPPKPKPKPPPSPPPVWPWRS